MEASEQIVQVSVAVLVYPEAQRVFDIVNVPRLNDVAGLTATKTQAEYYKEGTVADGVAEQAEHPNIVPLIAVVK
jgi:hypothetical protein